MTGGEHSQFAQAFHPGYLFTGMGASLAALYALLSIVGAPVLLFYGVVRGLDQSAPHVIVPEFIGALLGAVLFRKEIRGDVEAIYYCVFRRV